MIYLIDSSVCLRTIELTDPLRTTTLDHLSRAVNQGDTLIVVAQVVAECWGVLTRPQANNGFGLNPMEAKVEVDKLLAFFQPESDPHSLIFKLSSFAELHQVSGRQIHDARMALTCELLGLDGIVTYNKPDFARYSQIRALEPAELL